MPKILVVDDEPYIRMLLQQTLEDLEDRGVEVIAANDGQTALEIIKDQRPELVFLDVMMPRMNGFSVCQTVKRELLMDDVYICMVTARGQGYDKQRGDEVGADRYLTKPFDPDELLVIAQEVLNLEEE
jgi:DNA-binding response OmpR family regulator